MIDLGTRFPSALTNVVDMNSYGQIIANWRSLSGDSSGSVLIQSGMGTTDLPAPPNATTYVSQINDMGQIVGVITSPASTALWDKGLNLHIGALTGAVNNCGQVFDGRTLWQDGQPVAVVGAGDEFVSFRLSDSGHVAGAVYVQATGNWHAATWDAVNGLHELGSADNDYSEALGINLSDQIVGYSIVGYSQNPAAQRHAFLYDNGTMNDLNTLISASDATNWFLGNATAINDLGQIVGTGLYNGEERAFLLTPTDGVATAAPEPGTLLLMAAGAGLILTARPRRRD